MLLIFGALHIISAVTAASVAITQNDGVIGVHAFGESWNVQAYWLFVAGVVGAAAVALGLMLIRESGVRSRRARERASGATAPTASGATAPTASGATAPTAGRSTVTTDDGVQEDEGSSRHFWQRGAHGVSR